MIDQGAHIHLFIQCPCKCTGFYLLDETAEVMAFTVEYSGVSLKCRGFAILTDYMKFGYRYNSCFFFHCFKLLSLPVLKFDPQKKLMIDFHQISIPQFLLAQPYNDLLVLLQLLPPYYSNFQDWNH